MQNRTGKLLSNIKSPSNDDDESSESCTCLMSSKKERNAKQVRISNEHFISVYIYIYILKDSQKSFISKENLESQFELGLKSLFVCLYLLILFEEKFSHERKQLNLI